eukprot:3364719-Alexandrium_andersonii.AAC.1
MSASLVGSEMCIRDSTSKLAPIQITTGPEVVLCHASGYPTSVVQKSATAHSLARSRRLPPATHNGSWT